MSYRQKDDVHLYPIHDVEANPGPQGEKDDERVPLSPRGSPAPSPHTRFASASYPPRPKFDTNASDRTFQRLDETPGGSQNPHGPPSTPGGHHKNSSWDVLNFQKGWEGFDSRNASQAAFQYAEGDAPETKLGKLYLFLINASIVTRWLIFIVPVLALLWIPGILSVTAYPNAHIWHVRLLWWSVWWTFIWVGWWAALAAAMLLPIILRNTLGLGAISLRKYFDWLVALKRPVAFTGWSIAVYVSFNPIIDDKFTVADGTAFPGSRSALTTVDRLMFGLFLCAVILLIEKFIVQLVAFKFHQRSYADRIAFQKKQMECLVILYRNSTHVEGVDTPEDGAKGSSAADFYNPTKLLRKALHGVRHTAQTTTSAFGNLATEIAGSSVLQPNSPAAMVSTALASANKSRRLALRLYYSFRAPGADRLILGDIGRFFPNREMATFAFEIFDKDENGDATREEMEAAVMEIHTERQSLAASMKDIDSATSRLDDILLALYFIVVLLIFAIMLDAQVSTLATGAGTFILGLSWLIGGSAQEVLTSIIFLFVKHPYDIGDVTEIDTATYTVKEIFLLSTIFVDSRGCDVQAPHSLLNTKYILNRRRSGAMSETVSFTCGFATTFEQIEDLRSRMLNFVKTERRDYLPIFDVQVNDIADQSKMLLTADIKYKSNWQQGALKAQRRNKWVCALKNALAASKIYGPAGDPDAPAGTQQVTLIPYHDPAETSPESTFPSQNVGPELARTNYAFSDTRAARLEQGTANVFGEEDDLRSGMSGGPSLIGTPAMGVSRLPGEAGLRSRRGPGNVTPPLPGQGQQQSQAHWAPANEEIEMVQPPVRH